MSARLRGSCHCGNLSFDLDWPSATDPVNARRCGCSFCTRHGGVWTSNPAGELNIRIHDPSRVSRYEFGTETAQFLVCARCGAVPLVISRIEGRDYAVVNVNCLEGITADRIQISPASFDAEDLDSRLARRQRHWIGTVRIAEGNL